MTTTIAIQRGEIATVPADVLVNATTTSLLGDALLEAAGPGVMTEVQRIRESNLTDGLRPGDVVATNAGNLPAKWIVHTVGPDWDRDEDRSDTLASCYIESIELADKLGAVSIVFPAIGTALGWPLEAVARVAIAALQETDTHLETATFVLTDTHAVEAFEKALSASLEERAAG